MPLKFAALWIALGVLCAQASHPSDPAVALQDFYAPANYVLPIPKLDTPFVTTLQRNVYITKAYDDFSEQLKLALNCHRKTASFSANWLHYAVWASRWIGQLMTSTTLNSAATLMGEPYRRALIAGNYLLGDEVLRKTAVLVLFLKQQCSDPDPRPWNEVRDAFLKQNFHESPTSPTVGSLLKSLQFGRREIPNLNTGAWWNPEKDGLLAGAFFFYLEAFQSSGQLKEEQIFLANLLLGLHEQLVVQPFVHDTLERFRRLSPSIQLWLGPQMLRMILPNSTTGCKRGVSSRLIGISLLSMPVPYPSAEDLSKIVEPRLREFLEQAQFLYTAEGSPIQWDNYEERVGFLLTFFNRYRFHGVLETASPYWGWCGSNQKAPVIFSIK